jgi:ankyrin repeat protein
VKQALDALPATLDDTYTRVLLDIDDMYHDHALTLLRWLAYARSPPTLGELVDAAVTDPIHESSIDADNRGDLEDTLNILSGLVTVEESKDAEVEGRSETKFSTTDVSIIDHDSADVGSHSRDLTPDTRVRLAHFSVKEYLESKRILKSRADQFYLESATGHRVLAQSCLTYLRYYSASCEKILTIQDLETFPLLKYAAHSWFYHSTLQCGGEASRELSILRLEQVRDDWLVIHDPDKPWREPFTGRKDEKKESGSEMYYASLLGLPAVVTKLLSNGANVNAEGGRYGSPIQAASAEGHEGIVQLLIDNGANVNAEGGGYGSPIQTAPAEGHEGIVQFLIDNGANVNAEGGLYGSPIQAASERGHEGIVQLLIDNGANVNAEGGLYGSPIQAASERGHKAIVQLLIDNGANVNAEGGHYGSPIQAASERGHKAIVQLLIDNGANVNAEGGHYGSPIQAASERGHKAIVQLLIDNGANVNAEGGHYGSPIQAASERGHEGIVQLLVDNGANVNAEGGLYGSPTQAASAEGDKNIA